jgi:hypothetical protein
MKKLRLKALSLGATEILNRDQLRAIMGGDCDGCTHGWCDAGICRDYDGGGGPSGSGPDGCAEGFVHCGNCGCQTDSFCTQNGGCAM